MQQQQVAGKTKVLVERIINKIINENIDIDRLLVVTFTKASAAEMRERILNAIYEKLDENPNDMNLQKQLVLLNRASISTMHAFCLEVIKNNFYKIDISPNFRVAETAEIELLKMEVLEDLFDNLYEEENSDFLKILNMYCSYRDDGALKDLILKIHRFIQSTPFPEKWLIEQREKFNLDKIKNIEDTKWCKMLLKDFKREVNSSLSILKNAEAMLQKEDGLDKCKALISSNVATLENILNYDTWDGIYELTKQKNLFGTWQSDKKIQSNIKDEVQKMRDNAKKIFNNASGIFKITSSEMIEDINSTYNILKIITKMVIRFSQSFQNAKKEKNIVDFSDIEHFAINILLNKDEAGSYVPTEIAKMYQEKFIEIAIDEYQDTNLVQNEIINAISRGNNVFMVGDVKQSIYKFRQARPELFLKKYETFGDSMIQLFDNFRSRKDILDLTNEIFKTIMTKELGDIDYTEKEYLSLGIEYPEPKEKVKTLEKPELHIINLKTDVEDEFDKSIENAEIEAKFVAHKIKEMLEQGYFIYDKKKGYRKASFKDFVILLRTANIVAPIYEKALTDLKYPVFTDVNTNYFETMEIQIVLALLKIIDNPNNDIALVSVLRSAIGNFTDNDLIRIRTEYKNIPFYQAFLQSREIDDEKLKAKVNSFLEMIEDFREKQEYLSLDELIWYIYEKTGFYNFVMLMPNGLIKAANLKMLFEKAKDYEQGSFKGLYNFINFIDRLNKIRSDMGTPKLIGENEKVIRIMSIHKSKGLEFPIVFLCNTGKGFNFQDLNAKVLLHQDLGFGMDYIDYEKKVEYDTITREALKMKMKEEILAEEMRLLYVAITRSREKIIITGVDKNLEKSLGDKQLLLDADREPTSKINKSILKTSKSHLDWLEMVYLFNKNFRQVIDVEMHNVSELKDIELKKMKTIDIKNVKSEDESLVDKFLNFEYKYKDLTKIEGKSSVSKITKKAEDKITIKKPQFMEEELKLTNAEIGTVVHLVLQKLDFNKNYDREGLQELLENLVARKIMTEVEKEAVPLEEILHFTESELYQRIKNAKEVHRESPFYLDVSASRLYDTKSNENILVQGIIDLYFIDKEGKLVLIDYKTDYIKNNVNELMEKYKNQLEIYKEALEKALGEKVDEVYIYSTNTTTLIPLLMKKST